MSLRKDFVAWRRMAKGINNDYYLAKTTFDNGTQHRHRGIDGLAGMVRSNIPSLLAYREIEGVSNRASLFCWHQKHNAKTLYQVKVSNHYLETGCRYGHLAHRIRASGQGVSHIATALSLLRFRASGRNKLPVRSGHPARQGRVMGKQSLLFPDSNTGQQKSIA